MALASSRLAFGTLLISLAFLACATTAPAPTSAGEPVPPPPSTEVFFYPARGQSQARQERDRYECYRWAVKRAHFDPSVVRVAPHQQVRVVATPPPGADMVAGAVTGALIGAAVSNHHHHADGAAIGAVAGGLLGALSDGWRQSEARRLEQAAHQRGWASDARLELAAQDYRRAMSACLEGRGYTVQ